eukprot:CAMPEP_0172206830 /NCGR_PEP_ID=MMETSP1050-20130122/33460_1 /TAXON_ID=233186 /ORGANISM="Cryptomonas curvata, Strain CCAP979/52" /LENGTH=66 /DNA_ID=CAMNT_0012886005 /DNA_START=76 /DNA_END=273 /DNA_ORIENTATION=+
MVKKTQDEMSSEIASFTAKRKEALERAEKLREERKALQRQRETMGNVRLHDETSNINGGGGGGNGD